MEMATTDGLTNLSLSSSSKTERLIDFTFKSLCIKINVYNVFLILCSWELMQNIAGELSLPLSQ